MHRFRCVFALCALLLAACGREAESPKTIETLPAPPASSPVVVRDPQSYAQPQAFRTRNLDLDLTVDFDARILDGSVTLDLERVAGAPELVLDTRELTILGAAAASADGAFADTAYTLGEPDPILGSPLRITMPPGATRVRIRYRSVPQASGLQWLTPAQTAGGKQPFLFTQSQAIHARSWIPLQDTPQVRATYSATVRTPKALRAVMSAQNDPDAPLDGEFHFQMPQPIPSYLIALAVGDLQFAPIGPRTGIYAEPPVVAAAAREFEDTEKMLAVTEDLFGPYRWGRYDLLILPPSFPYGGMENPRLTFATPTVIAGDKSLVSLVAHELAHSWSGNLVTNATWSDFWLNEGFTTFLTYRIMEAVYGEPVGQLERALGAQSLRETLARTENASDKTLHPDLDGRDPDENFSDIPYERGALFLSFLEHRFGRDRFEPFLRRWFDEHAFQSATTAEFLAYLDAELRRPNPDVVSDAEIQAWVYTPEMPASTIWPQSEVFAEVDAQRADWLAGKLAADKIDVDGWNSRQWEYFLNGFPEQVPVAKLKALDAAFGLTDSGNAVIRRAWFRQAVRHGDTAVYPAVARHLKTIGRMSLITPIYRELAKTEAGRRFADKVYAEAKPGYHPIAQAAVERVLKDGADGQ